MVIAKIQVMSFEEKSMPDFATLMTHCQDIALTRKPLRCVIARVKAVA